MNEEPLISVVIPFFNAEAFLLEGVESVLRQSYGHWELLLVDDGSTDGSTEIALRYAQRHPGKVRYLAHDGHRNRGISASRNLGRRHAGGTWIAPLDADDVWLPGKLEQQVVIAETHPDVGLIIGATVYWHSWTGKPEDRLRDTVTPLGGPQDVVVAPPRLLELLYPLGPGMAPCPATFLVRTDVLDRVGGWEDHADNSYEDQYLLVKIYLTAPVYISAQCWARYRQHPSSSMVTGFAGDGYDVARRRFLEWFEMYLRERELTHAPVWRLVQKALWKYRHPHARQVIRLARRSLAGLRQMGFRNQRSSSS